MVTVIILWQNSRSCFSGYTIPDGVNSWLGNDLWCTVTEWFKRLWSVVWV